MKIVIFDPNLADSGHYRHFNWHVAKLLDESGIEVIFADYAGYFTRWYKDLSLRKASFKVVEVLEYRSPRKSIEGPMHNPIKYIITYIEDRNWYKHVSKNIEYLKPDIVIITSQGNPALYSIKMCTPTIIILHTIRAVSYRTVKNQSVLSKLKLRFTTKVGRNFSSKTNGIVVLEEKLKDMLENIGYKSVFRMPYLLFDDSFDDNTSKLSKEFLVSTVGGIYSGKNIEFVLNCIEREQFPEFKYRVAGKPMGDYGPYIKGKVENLISKGVTGRFEFLSVEDYVQEIEKAHFIVLPYSDERSDQTSGVMFDAIGRYRPIIAPNIEPFASYVNNYNIGLSYKEGDGKSFIETVNKAKRLGARAFMDDIIKFYQEFAYENWKPKFLEYVLSVANKRFDSL